MNDLPPKRARRVLSGPSRSTWRSRWLRAHDQDRGTRLPSAARVRPCEHSQAAGTEPGAAQLGAPTGRLRVRLSRPGRDLIGAPAIGGAPRSSEHAKSQIVRWTPRLDDAGRKVAPAGFEPAISALKGPRPRPLDDGASLEVQVL